MCGRKGFPKDFLSVHLLRMRVHVHRPAVVVAMAADNARETFKKTNSLIDRQRRASQTVRQSASPAAPQKRLAGLGRTEICSSAVVRPLTLHGMAADKNNDESAPTCRLHRYQTNTRSPQEQNKGRRPVLYQLRTSQPPPPRHPANPPPCPPPPLPGRKKENLACPMSMSSTAGSSVKVSSAMFGFSDSTTAFAASGFVDRRRQYTNPRSLKSGSSLSSVASCSTRWTMSCFENENQSIRGVSAHKKKQTMCICLNATNSYRKYILSPIKKQQLGFRLTMALFLAKKQVDTPSLDCHNFSLQQYFLAHKIRRCIRLNPFRAPKPLRVLNPSNLSPKTGFQLKEG